MLPDYDAVSPAWKPCAEQLYARLAGRLLLPHAQGGRHQGRHQWVAPNAALALAPPTEASDPTLTLTLTLTLILTLTLTLTLTLILT